MLNYEIHYIINVIENTDANRKRYEWEKKYTPEYAPLENVEAREIRRLGQALQKVVNPHNRLTALRGY